MARLGVRHLWHERPGWRISKPGRARRMTVLGAAESAALAHARELAAHARGRVSPNPLVGAVILRDGRLIAEGWHEGPGRPHAEVMALRAAGEGARGATLVC